MAKKQNGFIFEDKLKTVEVSKIRGRVMRKTKPIATVNRQDATVNNYVISSVKLSDSLKLSSVVMYKLETVLKTVVSTD